MTDPDHAPELRYPPELRYHREHAWARLDGRTARFGITWYAQDRLQEIVYVDLPTVGTSVTRDQPYGDVESIKTVSDVYAPLSGVVVAVNTALEEGAGVINADPYGPGWLVEVELSDPAEADALLSAEQYAATATG